MKHSRGGSRQREQACLVQRPGQRHLGKERPSTGPVVACLLAGLASLPICSYNRCAESAESADSADDGSGSRVSQGWRTRRIVSGASS